MKNRMIRLSFLILIYLHLIVFSWHSFSQYAQGHKETSFSYLSVALFVVLLLLSILAAYIVVIKEEFLFGMVVIFCSIIGYNFTIFVLEKIEKIYISNIMEVILYICIVSICFFIWLVLRKNRIICYKTNVIIYLVLLLIHIACISINWNNGIKSIITSGLAYIIVIVSSIMIENRKKTKVSVAVLLFCGIVWSSYMGYEYGRSDLINDYRSNRMKQEIIIMHDLSKRMLVDMPQDLRLPLLFLQEKRYL